MMRLDVDFPRPMARADKLAVALAVAGLAKSRGVRFARGDRSAVVSGEALTSKVLIAALAEVGIPVDAVRSSLADETPLDEIDDPRRERVRAIGR